MSDGTVRVMHILPHAAAGGATLATMQLARRLDPTRYDVSLAIGPDSGDEDSVLDQMQAQGLDVTVIPHMRRGPDLSADGRALVELAGEIHRRRPHVIHAHGSKSKLLAPLAAAAGGVPVRVAHVWGWEWMPARGPAQRCACRWAARVSAEGYDALIACSGAMREQGLARAVGEAGQYVVAPPAVDLDRFIPDGRRCAREQVRRELGVPADATLVVSVMRLARQKAPEVMLRAARLLADELPDLRWLIAGGGPLAGQVREMAADLDLHERVILAGPRRDVPRLLKAADIFALSSAWEPFGIVYLEAAAVGLPVVGTRVDGAVEAVADGETGILVETHAPERLADAVARLASDPGLAARLGEAGAARARQFGQERFVGAVEAVYERLLREKLDGQPLR